jgi:hypothetical protein
MSRRSVATSSESLRLMVTVESGATVQFKFCGKFEKSENDDRIQSNLAIQAFEVRTFLQLRVVCCWADGFDPSILFIEPAQWKFNISTLSIPLYEGGTKAAAGILKSMTPWQFPAPFSFPYLNL